MNKTKIEWCHYTWNPITGCTVGCEYCYARKLVKRFPERYPRGFLPTFYSDRLDEPYRVNKPSRIFCCSMGDFWDNNISDGERFRILVTITANPQHRFLILTKRPENIHPLIMNDITSGEQLTIEIPRNLWLGVTVDYPGTEKRIDTLIQNGGPLTENLFVSFEPLLGYISPNLKGIKWVIIGAQTNPEKRPERNWVKEILFRAGDYYIPVFEKNNLIPPAIEYYWARRNEYPTGLVL